MGQTNLMTGGTNEKLQTAGGKRTLLQVAQCDQGSLFSRILKNLGAFATVYSQYRALEWVVDGQGKHDVAHVALP